MISLYRYCFDIITRKVVRINRISMPLIESKNFYTINKNDETRERAIVEYYYRILYITAKQLLVQIFLPEKKKSVKNFFS